MRQGEPAFGHHLGKISKAELVSQIPAHAEHDDLLVKVPALEEPVHFRVRSSALSFDRFCQRLCCVQAVRTRALDPILRLRSASMMELIPSPTTPKQWVSLFTWSDFSP